jgi:hypothetical protein
VSPLRVDRHPAGPRLYLAGRRVHHGAAALAGFAACGRSRRPLLQIFRLTCLLAFAHDIRDFPFRDCDNHERKR